MEGCCANSLVFMYILNVLSSEFTREKIGLYRDGGLSCFQNMTGPQAEKINKKIYEIFQSCGLKLTIKTNLDITDFIDVTFNLKNGKYYPFSKPNNDPLDINAPSNHPKNIAEIPDMIGKHISEISCDKHEIEKKKGDYDKALEKSASSEKSITTNKVLLNIYVQEKLHGLNHLTVAISKQI